MSYAEQNRDLNAAGAAIRLEARGVDFTGNPQLGRMEDAAHNLTFPCYFSPDHSGELSIELGFKESHDVIIRVARSAANFVAVVGRSIRLIAANPDGSDLLVRIAAIGSSGVNPEYVVGCKNEF